MTTIAARGSVPEPESRRDELQDKGFSYVLAITAFFVLIALAGAALSMLWGGREVLAQEGLSFFFSAEWNPVENRYGALVPIFGTLVTALIAMIVGVPVSFGIAIYLTEVAPSWLRTPVGSAIELLAGIPSIIYG
ncbi:MAG TPA: phosphate ABC transporter permease subunit PstC, partial [Dokdonella sp.]|nr:phosphate ABC transporter permease subunit PstC [Dokdonella sp.]